MVLRRRPQTRSSWDTEPAALAALRSLAGRLGGLPDFVIIGAQRAGTTSLASWLRRHPAVQMARPKEVHYFDMQRHKGDRWYRSHFLPDRLGYLRGEATPYYLYHPGVPANLAACAPHVKLVVLLREPAERAYSHFLHERRHGFEPLPHFEQAIEQEPQRLAGEHERLVANPLYRSFAHNHFSYVDRGRYADQLRRWLDHVPRARMHVIISEDLFSRPDDVLPGLCAFLGLAPSRHTLPRQNAAGGPPMSDTARALIRATLAPATSTLSTWLGRALPWPDA